MSSCVVCACMPPEQPKHILCSVQPFTCHVSSLFFDYTQYTHAVCAYETLSVKYLFFFFIQKENNKEKATNFPWGHIKKWTQKSARREQRRPHAIVIKIFTTVRNEIKSTCFAFFLLFSLSENVSESFYLCPHKGVSVCRHTMHFAIVGQLGLGHTHRKGNRVDNISRMWAAWAAAKHDELNENGFVLRFLIHFSGETHHVVVYRLHLLAFATDHATL